MSDETTTAPAEKEKVTGWTLTVEVMCTGEGETERDKVESAGGTMDEFLDGLRAAPLVRLVKVGNAKFGTRSLDPQP